MRRIVNFTAVVLALGILAVSLSWVASKPVDAAVAAAVQVVNTPLPVQGNVNATVTGNVGLTGSPTVTIGNSATSPVPVRDADNAARSPFAGSCVATGQPSPVLT